MLGQLSGIWCYWKAICRTGMIYGHSRFMPYKAFFQKGDFTKGFSSVVLSTRTFVFCWDFTDLQNLE